MLTAALAKGNLPRILWGRLAAATVSRMSEGMGNATRVGRFVMICCWLGLAAVGSGCASIVEGTDQSVTVQTTPSGASCDVS